MTESVPRRDLLDVVLVLVVTRRLVDGIAEVGGQDGVAPDFVTAVGRVLPRAIVR